MNQTHADGTDLGQQFASVGSWEVTSLFPRRRQGDERFHSAVAFLTMKTTSFFKSCAVLELLPERHCPGNSTHTDKHRTTRTSGTITPRPRRSEGPRPAEEPPQVTGHYRPSHEAGRRLPLLLRPLS